MLPKSILNKLAKTCSSWQPLRPRLNYTTHYLIVVNEEAESSGIVSRSALILVGLRMKIFCHLTMSTNALRAFTIDCC